jgi:hypothetical protein
VNIISSLLSTSFSKSVFGRQSLFLVSGHAEIHEKGHDALYTKKKGEEEGKVCWGSGGVGRM